MTWMAGLISRRLTQIFFISPSDSWFFHKFSNFSYWFILKTPFFYSVFDNLSIWSVLLYLALIHISWLLLFYLFTLSFLEFYLWKFFEAWFEAVLLHKECALAHVSCQKLLPTWDNFKSPAWNSLQHRKNMKLSGDTRERPSSSLSHYRLTCWSSSNRLSYLLASYNKMNTKAQGHLHWIRLKFPFSFILSTFNIIFLWTQLHCVSLVFLQGISLSLLSRILFYFLLWHVT